MVAVGLALLIQYICLRFLGLNTVTAYQRAKVYGLKIMNKSLHRGGRNVTTVSENVTSFRQTDQTIIASSQSSSQL